MGVRRGMNCRTLAENLVDYLDDRGAIVDALHLEEVADMVEDYLQSWFVNLDINLDYPWDED